MSKVILNRTFFDRDPLVVAKDLLGKVLCVKYKHVWLKAIITETEAYYINDKASHSYLGYTKKRRALFMKPGTIYMYYSRGGDSLNISCRGEGNAVLIKSGLPFVYGKNAKKMLHLMQCLNPKKNSKESRPIEKLCSGQALLCKSLNLKIKDWDQKQFDRKRFCLASYNTNFSAACRGDKAMGDYQGGEAQLSPLGKPGVHTPGEVKKLIYQPKSILQVKRCGIPKGRDEHLPYRFIWQDVKLDF